jgi:hypothetical protein
MKKQIDILHIYAGTSAAAGLYLDEIHLALNEKYCNPTYAKNIGINAYKYYNLLRNKELWIKKVLKAINL